MQFGRLQCFMLTAVLVARLGTAANAGPLAVIANFTDPGVSGGPPWPPGTVTVLDTATDQPVGGPLTVGVNPMAVAITPDGKTAVVACSQSSDIWWIDLSANPPAVTGKLSLGTGSGDTFYPAGLAISPDGQFVAVTSNTGSQSQHSTQTRYIKLVSMKDQTLGQTVDLQPDGSSLSAEAAAISLKGAIVVVSPSAQPAAQIYALPYAAGQISFPQAPEDQQVGQSGHTGFNIALTPDGSTGIIPLWLGKFDVVSIDDQGKLTISQQAVSAGGNGTHSVAISPDGKKAYVRNLLPPANIAVFDIKPGPTLTDTGLRLGADGLPDSVVQLSQIQGNAFGFVGSQMVAVTPDGKKIYAVNPFAGAPDPAFLGLYGKGELQVFQSDKAAPIATLQVGKNPLAVAIQPK